MSNIIKKSTQICYCKNCGKEFEYDRKRANRKFCDDICRMTYYGINPNDSNDILKECKYCKKTFVCSRSTPTKLFCNNECLTAYYKEQHEMRSTTIEKEKRICPYCGQEFIWQSDKSWQKYCSTECSINANKEKHKAAVITAKKACAHCGNMFEWSSSKPNQKYCSAECRNTVMKVQIRDYQRKHNGKKTDDELKNEVYLKVLNIISKMDQSKGAVFNGVHIDYRAIGDISEKTREEVLKRDNFECQICKRKDSLHLHHLIKRKYGGNHNAENLVTLCASCHRHIETGDVDHATKKCYKNAKKRYGEDTDKEELDLNDLKFKLTVLFNKLKDSQVSEDTEIMVCLDEALDLLDIEEN